MTIIDICNRSLGIINKGYIASLEGSTKEEKLCGFLYPIIKQQVLGMYHWKSCLKYSSLQCIHDISSSYNNYRYTHLLPTDLIKIVKVVDLDNQYISSGKYLYSNNKIIDIHYICNAPETVLPLGLKYLIGLKLAEELAYNFSMSISELKNLRDMFEIQYRKQINEDSKNGENILNIESTTEPSWITSRQI